MEEGVCVQIVGDWYHVPSELRPLMAKVMLETRNNIRAKLNVAFAYTCKLLLNIEDYLAFLHILNSYLHLVTCS